MREILCVAAQCIITRCAKPTNADEPSDKPIKPKLSCSMGTRSKTGPDQHCLIIQPSREPHTDDNESLSVAFSGIEPPLVRQGSSRDRGPSHISISPVTSWH